MRSYCVRKMTLRAYVNLLALEDRIMSNVFYSKAAIGAVAVYLALHDRPDTSVKDAQDEEALMAAMDPAERKRYKAKKRKEEARRRKAEEEEAAAAAAAAAKEKAEKGKKGAAVKEKDPDPAGKELAATKDPLGEATKLVVELKVRSVQGGADAAALPRPPPPLPLNPVIPPPCDPTVTHVPSLGERVISRHWLEAVSGTIGRWSCILRTAGLHHACTNTAVTYGCRRAGENQ